MLRIALHWQIFGALILGAAAGLVLNFGFGSRGTAEDPVTVELESLTAHFVDSSNHTMVAVTPRDTGKTATYVIDPAVAHTTIRVDDATVSFSSLSDFEQAQPREFALFSQYGRSVARRVGDASKTIGGLFLRMLKMVSIPLIVTSLITGVAGLGSADRLGRLFGRTITYYVCTSLLAIVTGLVLVNVIRPGIDPNRTGAPPKETSVGSSDGKGLGEVMFEQIERLIPTNPIAALAQGEFLSIIAFSIAFGVFTILVRGEASEIIAKFFAASFQVMMSMTMAIIRLAPVGVFFLILYATATQGVEVFQTLGWYMLTVLIALVLHATIVLPLILHFVARQNPLAYARALSPALLTAFSSASSNATLPLTMTCVEQRAGVSNKVCSFVLPLGATVNMDGTALYEAIAVLFIAQMSGIDLSLSQQIIVALTALLASIGAAGIPHAGLVMMIIILQAVGLPTESQGLIIAVDRILDMARTSVNVWSDSCGCAVVARFEKAWDQNRGVKIEE